MDEITLDFQSNLGQRLKKIRKPEKRCLRFKDNTVPIATRKLETCSRYLDLKTISSRDFMRSFKRLKKPIL